MYSMMKMGIFQPAMLDYRSVSHPGLLLWWESRNILKSWVWKLCGCTSINGCDDIPFPHDPCIFTYIYHNNQPRVGEIIIPYIQCLGKRIPVIWLIFMVNVGKYTWILWVLKGWWPFQQANPANPWSLDALWCSDSSGYISEALTNT